MKLIWKCEDCDYKEEGTAAGQPRMITHQTKNKTDEASHRWSLFDEESNEKVLDDKGQPIRAQAIAKKMGFIEGTPVGRGHKAKKVAGKSGEGSGEGSGGKSPDVIQVRTATATGEPTSLLEKHKADIPVVSPLDVSIFELIPLKTTVYNTPSKWTSFACAMSYGFKGSIDEWLDLVSLDFWAGRKVNPFERLGQAFRYNEGGEQQEVAVAVKTVEEE